MADYYRDRKHRLTNLPFPVSLYPNSFSTSLSLAEFIDTYCGIESGSTLDNCLEKIGGRITSIRQSSKNLRFIDITGGNNRQTIQLLIRGNFPLLDELRRGDLIGVTGIPSRTKRGELSLLVHDLKLLAPCLHMLPFPNSLTDPETRYGQRYLDLLINDPIPARFGTRSKIIQLIRNFLTDQGFLEVETPTMSRTVGGANARPFVTRANDLDRDLYLRIAPELYLKQLLVGGFTKVFEIGKNYRNEGVDNTHNPEFTTCEFYWAYADYLDMKKLTEELLSSVVLNITGSLQVMYGDHQIDFTPPFATIDIISTLETKIGRPLILSIDELTKICEHFHIKLPHHITIPRLLDTLIGAWIEPLAINPTFLLRHPMCMSPLAKQSQGVSSIPVSDRFELFVAGKELSNAYTELNDPVIQLQTFTDQAKLKQDGDDEAQIPDLDYVKCLEYGLPPATGCGIGIDRLIMFLTNQQNIKEVLLFPL